MTALGGADFWREIFGSELPVEIEIGSGDGAFLLASAASLPSRNFFGIERSPSKAGRLSARLERIDAPNVRILQGDATCVVASIIPDESVATYHVYFPDPWPKRGHANRRIFSPGFVARLARTLSPGGRLFFATDVSSYATVTRERVLADGGFVEAPSSDQHPGMATSFARKYRAAGRPLYFYGFVHVDVREPRQVFAASKMRSM